MKRARAESLTGGTGDVNPQLLSDSATQSAADTNTTTQVNLPIQRIASNAPQQAVIMELLKIFVDLPDLPAVAAVAETADTIGVNFSTRNFGTTATTFDDPSIFARAETNRLAAFTAGGTYMWSQRGIITVDLTDGAGHGVLIGTDSIFVQVTSGGTGNANTVRYKLLYRWKRVTLAEYIGIVQSQQ